MPVPAVTAVPCGTACSSVSDAARGLRLRLLTPADEPLVRRGFIALSPASRHLRYGLPLREVDRALEWMHLLGDGTHVALGACDRTGDPVGVARYVRGSESAEVAVTVVDAWQGEGAGTLLLDSLCTQAWVAGISVLRASILVENVRALKLAQRFAARRTGRNGGMLEYELQLQATQMGRQSRRPRLDAGEHQEVLE